MKEVKYTPGFELNTPSWDELLFNLNLSKIKNGLVKNPSPGFWVSHNAERIKRVQYILKKLNLVHAHLYISLLENSPTFGKHSDGVDVWFWQVRGSSKWTINDKKEYILKEGDLIYIPKKIPHNVTPLGPRAGISMSYE